MTAPCAAAAGVERERGDGEREQRGYSASAAPRIAAAAAAVLAALPACRAQPACASMVRATTEEVRRPGEVEILTYAPSTRLSLTRRTGSARVAWRAGESLPVVQCVRVRRDGPADRRRRRAAGDLAADRPRGALLT